MIAIALVALAMALVVASAQQPKASPSSNLSAQSPTGTAAELDQCRNGGVGATPVPCNPSTKNPLGWVNGNAQGQQAHWREGDSIAYRVVITGLSPNSVGNTLLFNWSTVHGSHHSIDYITSYDRTETTSSTPSQFFANNNNPCSDVLSAANCVPASPTTAFPIPSPLANGVLTNCGGSSGTFVAANLVPAGSLMQIKGYGGTGLAITAVAYQSVQVPSGTGQCSTGFLVTFTAGSTSTVVLAWGGHIASQADWGVGNSASFISGSPYHMFLDSLNGASTGAQDRALATSAIFFTPSISTTVIDESTGLAIVSPASAGISVHDTALLSGASPSAGGTVTYRFWSGVNQCPASTGFTTQTVTVTNGVIPNSASTGALAAGFYSYNASYSGDISGGGDNFPAFSACEPFQIGKNPTTTATTLHNAADNSVIANGASLPLGSSVYDTATVSGQVGALAITGTVSFTFYTNGLCSGTGVSAGTASVGAGGSAGPSSTEGPLAAGSYSFKATYGGDSSYTGSTSSCEPFSINQAPTTITTTLHNAADNSAIANGASVSLGTSVYDTASVTGQVGAIAITGTVTFNFFLNGLCSGTPAFTETLAIGTQSSTQGPLTAGSYSFDAMYNGDTNYQASAISSCEPFSVNKAPTTITTTLHNAADNSAIANGAGLPLGSSVYDTAAVSGQVGAIAITGTVTFNFFTNGLCSGTPAFTETVSLGTQSSTQGPLTAGSYSFDAMYNGDTNYAASPISGCEPFTVNKAPTTTTTTLHNAADNSVIANGASVPLGTSVYDTASVSGQVGAIPITGTVTFNFFLNGLCSGTPAFTETVAFGSSSSTQGPLAAGSYSFDALYNGDSNYAASAISGCEPFTVNQAPTTTTTTLHNAADNSVILNGASVPLGTSVYDTASVSGQVGAIAITGTVTFNFFTNGLCTGTPSSSETKPLGSPSSTQGPLTAGSYSFDAKYNGDANYAASAISGCEPFTVNQAPTTITTTLHNSADNSVVAEGSHLPLASSVYDTASVSGQVGAIAITGTVTFNFFLNGACSGTPAFSETVAIGSSSSPQGPLGAGSYAFDAVYNGDTNYQASPISGCEPFIVDQAPTSATTTLHNAADNSVIPVGSSVTLGSSVYDTVSVGPAVPPFAITGQVTYNFFTNGLCSGTPAFTETLAVGSPSSVHGPLLAGSYSFDAQYLGDANYQASQVSACEPFIVPLFPPSAMTTAVFTSANVPVPLFSSVALGTSVYDTASVSGQVGSIAITGTVTFTFFMNGACSGNGISAGTAAVGAGGDAGPSSTEGPLAAGSYSFQAAYGGDSNYLPTSSGCEPFTVNQAPTTTTTTLHNAADDSAIANNAALPLGTSVYDTASVSGQVGAIAITGTVTFNFFTNGACSGSPAFTETVAIGTQSSTQGPLTVGSYSFDAMYNGDTNYAASLISDCEPFTVSQAPTSATTTLHNAADNSVIANGASLALGSSVYDTVAVSGQVGAIPITGTVTFNFFMNGLCSGTPSFSETVAIGSSSSTQGPLGAGSYSFDAIYNGDTNYAASQVSGCEPFSVNQAPSTISTTLHNAADNSVITVGSNVPTGTSVYDTSTVSGQVGSIPMTGTVTYAFFTNGGCSGTPAQTFGPLALGSPSPSVGPLGAGSYSFQATYSGDANYAGSLSSCEPFSIVIPSGVTDTNFCTVTQFRLIFIQDSPSTYALTASNPGQFYSNVFATLSAPGSLSVSATIPYPYVTQGAVPIQVFYNQPLPTCGSTVPSSNVNGEFTISPTAITLSSYGASPTVGVSTVTVTFTSKVTLPAGLYWFAIHLNYGLKGFDYSKGTQSCPVATSVTGPSVSIGCPQSYGFSNSITGGTPVTSVNTFNKDPGIAGVVTDSVGTPVAGATVTVTGAGMTLTATTDQNGFYSVAFKGSGKSATFTVVATFTYQGTAYTASATVTMKLNTIALVNLSFSNLVLV